MKTYSSKLKNRLTHYKRQHNCEQLDGKSFSSLMVNIGRIMKTTRGFS